MTTILKPREPKPSTTPLPAVPVEGVEPRIAELRAFLAARASNRGYSPGEFEAFERRVIELGQAVARAAIATEMAAADVAAEAIEVAGTTLRRVLRSPQTYMTAAGAVTVARWLYKDRRDEGARAVSPLDLRVGIVDGFWTPQAAKRGVWVVSQMTPSRAAELFERVGTMQPSKASLDRLPKAVSDRWEVDRAGFEDALRDALVIPDGTVSVAVSLDGVMAPMEGTAPVEARHAAAAAGRLTRGPIGYREIGCATLSFCDAKGDLLAAVRIARAPEAKKATLKTQLVAEVAAVLRRRSDLRLVKLADAGGDNWEFLAEALPDGAEAVDFFHAAEHLHAAIGAVFGDGTRVARARYEALYERLRDEVGGAERVIQALARLRRTHPSSSILTRELAYFRAHRHRMHYADLKARGLPIGSGVVEAACKTLVTQRLKLSGMRWSARGAQAILTMRGWDQSERFDLAWALLAATFQAEIHVFAHVIPIKTASR